MARVDFDPVEHVYRARGHIVPSVTTILRPLMDFGGVPADVLARAAEFGTHAHQAVDLHNKGTLDEASLDPSLAPYLAGWRLFLSESGAHVVGSELRVYHPGLRYAGTLDTLVRLRGKVVLVDVKTGQVPRTVGPQLAAYQQAYESDEDNEFEIRRRLCVQLTGDGYRLHECKDPADFAIFQSALNIYHWRSRNAA